MNQYIQLYLAVSLGAFGASIIMLVPSFKSFDRDDAYNVLSAFALSLIWPAALFTYLRVQQGE